MVKRAYFIKNLRQILTKFFIYKVKIWFIDSMIRLIWNKQSNNFKKKERNSTKIDANKMISKEGLKWKCREHHNVACELICLDEDAN